MIDYINKLTDWRNTKVKKNIKNIISKKLKISNEEIREEIIEMMKKYLMNFSIKVYFNELIRALNDDFEVKKIKNTGAGFYLELEPEDLQDVIFKVIYSESKKQVKEVIVKDTHKKFTF